MRPGIDDLAEREAPRRPSVSYTTSEKAGRCTCCSEPGLVSEVRLASLTFRVCPECSSALVSGLRPLPRAAVLKREELRKAVAAVVEHGRYEDGELVVDMDAVGETLGLEPGEAIGYLDRLAAGRTS